jgi:hypothetical protein
MANTTAIGKKQHASGLPIILNKAHRVASTAIIVKIANAHDATNTTTEPADAQIAPMTPIIFFYLLYTTLFKL